MSENMTPEPEQKGRTITEELEVAGNQLVEQVQNIIKEGNVRRIVIKNAEGEEIIHMTLTVGSIAAGAVVLAAPWLAALGAIAALIARVKIEIVREETEEPAEKSKLEE